MAQLRLAMAQVNPTVGDLEGNSDLIVDYTRRAADAGAHLVVFPEMVLTGYPVEDLALRGAFVDASITALHALARRLADTGLGDLPVAVGYLDRHRNTVAPTRGQPAGAPHNAVALLYQGQPVFTSAKHHLPNYGVFDEARNFVPGTTLPVVRLHSIDVAFVICEDLWQDGGPVAAVREAEAGLLVVINGSPYERGKRDTRLGLCTRRARETQATVAYVNLVGGQDELVFDGDSLIVHPDGRLLARAPQFEEHLLVADLELPDAVGAGMWGASADAPGITIQRHLVSADPVPAYEPRPAPLAPRRDEIGEVYAALVLATRDYVHKNRFPSVLLGLSGGIDSALVATIAVDALGADRVHGVLMPSRYSTDHSVTDAEELARRQGINARIIPVAPLVEAFENAVKVDGLAEENLQARVRGQLLMTLSNQEGHLVLTTGNKSELAVGYSTLYGDSAGGFAPIRDVWKTLVWELARWRNAEAERNGQVPPIPEHSITKPPSAELRPGQLDTDSLPEYDVLDALLDDYVGTDLGRDELVAAGHDPELVDRVIRMVDRAEYKRRQYPPGPKISTRNFGRDRRVPITSRWTV
ncbi:NH(3)-dependent NAD(+) synthetase [Thermobifida fusca TM51]|uniref:Glutamine-dependent NAD(+) synthetase n=2 Tax=Thermobifida fusca TaxID=2021 RepID=A0A9P2TBD4_THEFU|nr:NAD+ synthase [Thermobifida fusca]EOR71870.1 NH(3)-dependent NAD(+) synthetase [Thermobifida fusca TM51]